MTRIGMLAVAATCGLAALGRVDAFASGVATAAPAPGSPAWAEAADVDEHLGVRLPLDRAFVDARGRRIPLRSLFDGIHPVMLVLAYYECPQLCSLVLDGAAAAIQQLERQGFALGSGYRVATISFDASERIDQAARKQASVLAKLGRPDPDAWPFLVGDEHSVAALTRALGFRFLRDPATGTLAHAAVVFVLTPGGVISRYLYGVDTPARDLRLALLEASDGKTGSLGDRVIMRCFQYDPATRRYGLFISRFMKLGGLLVFVVVLAALAGFVRYDQRRRTEHEP